MVAAIKANGDRQAHILLNRAGEIVSVNVAPQVQWVRYAGAKWVFPGGYATLEDDHKPAAGLEEFDELVSIDGRKIKPGADMVGGNRRCARPPMSVVVKGEKKSRTVSARRRLQALSRTVITPE